MVAKCTSVQCSTALVGKVRSSGIAIIIHALRNDYMHRCTIIYSYSLCIYGILQLCRTTHSISYRTRRSPRPRMPPVTQTVWQVLRASGASFVACYRLPATSGAVHGHPSHLVGLMEVTFTLRHKNFTWDYFFSKV